MTEDDLGDAKRPSARSALLPGSAMDSGQVAVLILALFLKGGLLGAYISFFSLWLHKKGYSNRELGIVSVVDAFFSLFLPVIGGLLDRLRSHNLGFTMLLVILTVLKLSYIPAAKSFVAILILTALTAPLLRASNSILDALALYAFPDKGTFSRVRLFGDLGFGCLALVAGVLYQWTGNDDVIFWIFASICITLAVFWTCVSAYMSSIRPDSKSMTRDEFYVQLRRIWTDVMNAKVARALFCLWLLGVGLGLVMTFELVLLDSLMGSGVLLGLCKLTGTLSAIPVWWYIPNAMDAIGTLNLQLVGLACAALRLMILGTITNPWHALSAELLAGMGGFAIAYGTITIFAGRVTDEDMKGTAQTMIFVIFTGLGAGGGVLVGGYVAHEYGIQEMFLLAGWGTAAVTITLFVYDLIMRFILGNYRSLEEACKNLP